jgi:secreted Zn-dependent insulinase-like peptidase
MQPSNPSADDLAIALKNITFCQYQAYSKQLFEKITLEVLIHGNWLIEHANEIVNNIKQALNNNYSNDHAVQCPVIDISDKETLILPLVIPEHDHATVVYSPLPTRDDNLVALTMVTSHLLSPLFFQEMRTDKQYGYLVGVGYVPINRYPGIAFYIQSPHTDAIVLTKAIDDFVTNCLEVLNDLNDDDWSHLIHGLAGQLQEKDNNLRIKSQRFWAAICNKDLQFTHKEQLVDAILSLKFDQVIEFIKNHLMTLSNPDRVILMSIPTEDSQLHKKLQKELMSGNLIKPHDFIKKSKRKH